MSNSFIAGYFNDEVPDFFALLAKGDGLTTLQIILNGTNLTAIKKFDTEAFNEIEDKVVVLDFTRGTA